VVVASVNKNESDTIYQPDQGLLAGYGIPTKVGDGSPREVEILQKRDGLKKPEELLDDVIVECLLIC